MSLNKSHATAEVGAQTPWLAYRVMRPTAPMRLFCLPHAGGGASLYRHWDASLSSVAEVCAVQLPGRETRLTEPAISNLRLLIPQLVDALEPYIDKQYAVFGHSMGALIAFEMTRELRRRGRPLPCQLFLASYCAPQLLSRSSKADTIQAEAAKQVAATGVVPDELKHELLAAFVPTLEADTRLCEGYDFVDEAPLPCPIAAYRGLTDYVRDDQLAGWRAQTSGAFHAQTFLGDHFFVRDTPRGVTQAVQRALARPRAA